MNISTSECSSGCESGWTTYLDRLSNSTNPHNLQNYQVKGANVNEDQEDEDLSMVSDASSGPPHLHESFGADTHCYTFASPVQEDKKKSKQKISKTKDSKMKNNHNFCLDDTASSPMLHYSQGNAVPTAHAFSTAHFEEEATPRKNVGFFKSSKKGKSGSLLGRKRQ